MAGKASVSIFYFMVMYWQASKYEFLSPWFGLSVNFWSWVVSSLNLHIFNIVNWLRWVFNFDDMFGIYVYWCSLLLLLDLQIWNKRRNLVCVPYYVVVFEYLRIQLKATLVKTKTNEITSKTLVQNLSWKAFYCFLEDANLSIVS